MKKSILAILAAIASICMLGACDGSTTETPQNPNPDSGIETPNPDDGNQDGNEGNEGNEGDEGGNQGGNEGNEGDEGNQQDPVDEVAELLRSAYALKSGETLSGTHTLTGVVSNVEKTGQGDICLTMKAVGYEQYPMYCFWLQDADFVEVGDTITVSGTIKNYNGKIEFDHPTLDDYVAAGGNQSGNTGSGSQDGTTEHLYTAFTAAEEALMVQYLGEVIPFIPNSDYVLESFYEDGDYSEGFWFYTVGNTRAEFNAYLDAFSSYQSTGTETDDYGNTWYYFEKGEIYIDVTYSQEDGNYYVDVYAYLSSSIDDDEWDDDNTGGENQGGNTGNENVTLITNHGKGLPKDTDGVFDVDFTKATPVKNVTDQGYYLDGCPTVGKAGVLVVPVEFSDVTAESKGYTVEKIKAAWSGASTADYYSVYDYYSTSSYGKLDLQITVLDTWFRPKNNSSYYKNSKDGVSGEENGDQLIIDEVLSSLEGTMDLTKFDCDGNSVIDSIVLIPTVDIDETAEIIFQWAYRYWNMYVDDDGYYYEYDGVSANDYLWAPYQFMLEGYDASGNIVYNKNNCNTYTFIHEFGHVLGADDYYDNSYRGGAPLDGCDVMDSMFGDHNAYTKFNYGWVTSSRLVVTDSSVTLTLEDFSVKGDSIILANDWDEALGAYQEYYVLTYYKNSGLNGGDGGYFTSNGVVMYHVNASLYKEIYEGETYYDVYNNNTDESDQYGTKDNLIELVKSSAGKYVFGVGDSLPTVQDDSGNALGYTFTVDAITDSAVTITFTKK